MITTRSSIVTLGIFAFVLIPLSANCHAADELPLELRPYRVALHVAFDAPQFSDSAKTGIIDDIRNAAARCIGSQWQLTVTHSAWVQPASREGLRRLTIADVASHAGAVADDFDVWIVAAIQATGSGWGIDVRSWQPAINVSPEPIGDMTYDLQEAPLLGLRLCYESFRPVGTVEDVDGKQVRVILQAGALPVPDDNFSQNRTGGLFAPVLASRNRDKKIERLQPIPWTYLKTVESTASRVTCELFSGLRTPIGGKQRGKVETLVVAVKPSFRSTLLDLATQSKPSLPLVAHRIELRNSAEIPRPEDGKEPDPRLLTTLLTDRRGQVTLPVNVQNPMIWLFAYSGKNLLARVPVIPGLVAKARLEVPDDSARLEAESELFKLQGELIEAVAARNTAVARMRAAVKRNDATHAKEAAADLKKLPAAQAYLNRVIEIRVPGVKAAKGRKDRAGEARINRMCDDMVELIKQYLSEDKRESAMEELKELFSDEETKDLPKTQVDSGT